MKVGQFKEVLSEIESIFAAGGAKKTADDFRELQGIFDGSDGEDLDQFLAELRRLYTPSKKPVLKLVEKLDELLVHRYVQRLQRSDVFDPSIDKAIEELALDSAVKKAEANAVQHRVLKGRETWPSKKAAVEAIRKALAHRRREADQLKRIQTTTPW